MAPSGMQRERHFPERYLETVRWWETGSDVLVGPLSLMGVVVPALSLVWWRDRGSEHSQWRVEGEVVASVWVF